MKNNSYHMCVHKSHSHFISIFLSTLKALVQKFANDCPLITLRNFNINILNDTNNKNNKSQLIDFMNRFKLKSQFEKNITKVESQLNHT
jgi:hypothetical protein